MFYQKSSEISITNERKTEGMSNEEIQKTESIKDTDSDKGSGTD